MKDNYACSICGKGEVKLWKTSLCNEFLICAECAEARQSPRQCNELNWVKTVDGYSGRPTGKRVFLSSWKVDEEGFVPKQMPPGPEGIPVSKTHQLMINLKNDIASCNSDTTCVIPAILDKKGNYLKYSSAPKSRINWWQSLPTRITLK